LSVKVFNQNFTCEPGQYFMSSRYGGLEDVVFVPRPFYLLTNNFVITHENASKYQIVESKNLPNRTPIIRGPIFTFWHDELVQCLISCDAPIAKVQKINLWRKSDGFETDDYNTLTVTNQHPWKEIITNQFQLLSINMVAETEGVFFSKNFYEKLKAITPLVLEESTLFSLTPIQ
jgi:hypothetical protein